METINRRTALKLMGMGAALLAAGGRGLAQQTPTADQLVKGKNAKLIVLSQRPVVMETPYDLLASNPERTSKEILYIRNNVDLPGYNTLEGASPQGWKVEVGGLVDKPFTFEASELFARLVGQGVRTIAFARARVVAELLLRYARDQLKRTRPE
ncbi:MAG: hypothetical protein ACK4ZX_03100, partial [Thermus sp.]